MQAKDSDQSGNSHSEADPLLSDCDLKVHPEACRGMIAAVVDALSRLSELSPGDNTGSSSVLRTSVTPMAVRVGPLTPRGQRTLERKPCGCRFQR